MAINEQSHVPFVGGPFDGQEISYWAAPSELYLEVDKGRYVLVYVLLSAEQSQLRCEYRYREGQQ